MIKPKACKEAINHVGIMIFYSSWIENTVEEGENAGYQNFLLSNNVFKRLPGNLKVTIIHVVKAYTRISVDSLLHDKFSVCERVVNVAEYFLRLPAFSPLTTMFSNACSML